MKKITLFVALSVAGGVALFWFSSPVGRPRVPVPEGAVENDPTANRPDDRRAADAVLLAGEWRSADDPAFTRVFGADGKFHDTYAGEPAGAPGTWSFADDGSGELRLSSEGDTMRFQVNGITEDSLSLTYLTRGNLLRFERLSR